ncbi:MAG: MgtC/SapB family protein [Planctomycetota bacterium]|nr:MgtC/SapB family protein [Planctomycetota bacterium]
MTADDGWSARFGAGSSMMQMGWPIWMGDIHGVLQPHWAGAVVTAAAIICGGMIGFERERALKPAGLRTMILICLGSAIFTQASILLADSGAMADRTRIAAQIVSGIGFLGAGAIIRERGRLVGVTTGAGIWSTAAVGMMLGSGHVAAGLFFSILILVTLSAAGILEQLILGRCRFSTVRIAIDGRDGKARIQIDHVLSRFGIDGAAKYEGEGDERQIVTVRYCEAHRHHRAVLPSLAALEKVIHIKTG